MAAATLVLFIIFLKVQVFVYCCVFYGKSQRGNTTKGCLMTVPYRT